MEKIDYKELVKRCKKAGTYCPDECKIYSQIANTPMHMRILFRMQGERKLKQK